jgi:hypothetical protein
MATTISSKFFFFWLFYRPELIVTQNIVGSIHSELYGEFLSGSKDLVGIESSVEEMMDLLNAGLNDVCFIGIWGKGGGGSQL